MSGRRRRSRAGPLEMLFLAIVDDHVGQERDELGSLFRGEGRGLRRALRWAVIGEIWSLGDDLVGRLPPTRRSARIGRHLRADLGAAEGVLDVPGSRSSLTAGMSLVLTLAVLNCEDDCWAWAQRLSRAAASLGRSGGSRARGALGVPAAAPQRG